MLQENIVQEGETQRLRPCSHTSLRPPSPLPFFFLLPLFFSSLLSRSFLFALLGLEVAAVQQLGRDKHGEWVLLPACTAVVHRSCWCCRVLQVAVWRGGAAGVRCSAIQQQVKVLPGVSKCCRCGYCPGAVLHV
jgi:hypothetical protein